MTNATIFYNMMTNLWVLHAMQLLLCATSFISAERHRSSLPEIAKSHVAIKWHEHITVLPVSVRSSISKISRQEAIN